MVKRVKWIMAWSCALIFLVTGCSNTSELEAQNQQYMTELEDKAQEIERLEGAVTSLTEQLNTEQDGFGVLSESLEEHELVIEELNTKIIELETEATESMASMSLLSTSQMVVELLQAQDFGSLATYVHPVNGVRLTPYPYVDVANDVVLNNTDVASYMSLPGVYLWGSYDGSGEPINLSTADYYNEFIYDHDFANPHMIGNNTIIGTGNMIHNIGTVYPSASFVEYHFTGFNPTYDGMDWSSLTLVFEQSGSTWYLVGIVHGQWTI